MTTTHDDRQRQSTNRAPTDGFANPTHETATTAAGGAGTTRDSPEAVPADGERGPGAGPPEETGRFAWLAVLPALATLAGVGVGLLAGFDLFDPGSAGAQRLVAYALLAAYVLLGVAGTRWLVEDASRLTAADADWQPRPLHYVLGGGLVVELYFLAPVVLGRGPETGVVQYLAGGFVVSLLLSSVVAGPVYLLLRRRHLAAT